jgi:hypothetical protein
MLLKQTDNQTVIVLEGKKTPRKHRLDGRPNSPTSRTDVLVEQNPEGNKTQVLEGGWVMQR